MWLKKSKKEYGLFGEDKGTDLASCQLFNFFSKKKKNCLIEDMLKLI